MSFELREELDEIELGALLFTAMSYKIAPLIIWERLVKEKLIAYKGKETIVTPLGQSYMVKAMKLAFGSVHANK